MGLTMGGDVGRGGKRSRRVRLVTMASTLAGGAALLSACGKEPEKPVKVADNTGKSQVEVYENVFECVKNTGMTQEQCMQARERAVAVAEETAPRYEGLADCEGEYGAGGCVENSSHSRHFFSPFVTGFLLGKMAGTQREATPLFRRSGDNNFSTANGVRLGYSGSPGKFYAVSRALERPREVPRIRAASKLASTGGLIERSRGFTLASRVGGSAFGGKSFGG